MARLPAEESRAFQSQFALVVTDSHLNLPAPGISEDNLPGEVGGMSGFRGEQIPGRLMLASGND